MLQARRRATPFIARNGLRGLRSLLVLGLACSLFVAAAYSVVAGA